MCSTLDHYNIRGLVNEIQHLIMPLMFKEGCLSFIIIKGIQFTFIKDIIVFLSNMESLQ